MNIEYIKAFILGIIQGITEWLPVSSTGHMILFENWFPLNASQEFINLFFVFIQIGSVLAVILLFIRTLNPWHRSLTPTHRQHAFVLWMKIAVASVPAVIIGLLFDDLIDTYLYTPSVIALMLIVYGALFIYVEKKETTHTITHLQDLKWRDVFIIGIFQTFAFIPGTSRSGATILGALWLGASRPVAAEFSFFLAIPALLGAGGIKLLKAGLGWSGTEWMMLLIGTATAFVVSVLVIKVLMNYVKKHNFTFFAYYRFALAALVILLLVFFK